MSRPPFRFLLSTSLAVAAAALCACAVGPDFVRPPPPDTDRYSREAQPAATPAADGVAQNFSARGTLPSNWWLLFKSPELNSMVDRAVADNPTLQAAESNLRQGQDNLRAGYGVFYPQARADLDLSRERTAPLQQGLATKGSIFNLVTLGGTLGYAVDVFGGERRTMEGLRAQADTRYFEDRAAFLTLSANVVDAGIARAGYAAQIRATRRLIQLEKSQLQLTADQVRSGTEPYANLLAVRVLLASNQALLAPLEQRFTEAGDLLATLEGAVPSQSLLPDIDLESLSLPTDLPVSLPSDLVRQRPDILSAEAQLHAASAGIGVATAAMFPSISLTATYGAASTGFGSLSAASARFWTIGPTVTVPLFQGGALWYGRKAAVDAYQGSQGAYRQTVLNAFGQVADSLKALGHDAEALQAQADARDSAREQLRLLRANYSAGLVAFPDVLAADVQLQTATVAYLEALALRHQDTVALFVALGGGWWNAPLPAPKVALP